jgi:hypothetical protein
MRTLLQIFHPDSLHDQGVKHHAGLDSRPFEVVRVSFFVLCYFQVGYITFHRCSRFAIVLIRGSTPKNRAAIVIYLSKLSWDLRFVAFFSCFCLLSPRDIFIFCIFCAAFPLGPMLVVAGVSTASCRAPFLSFGMRCILFSYNVVFDLLND